MDRKYCDFLDAAVDYSEKCNSDSAGTDYTVVGGLNIADYEADVKETYSQAITSYKTLSASLASASQTVTAPRSSDTSAVVIKKRDIPKFSGLRKDWPEFKSVWVKLVEPSLPNRTSLAIELKASCKEGRAYDEIKCISAGLGNAYDKMWSALCQQYDNVTLAVSSTLDEIQSFRTVQEEDYTGTVNLIRQIDSIYQQLSVLKQVSMVTNREVSKMMMYFPPLMKKDWAEHHFQLDSDAQLHPFESLHKFLSEKLKIAKHMADSQIGLKPLKSVQLAKKSSFAVSTKQPSSCVVHNSSGHSTGDCKAFKCLSVDEWKGKLMAAGRCFRCFGPHRRSKCMETSPCESCGKTTHLTLMCFPKVKTGSPANKMKTDSPANAHADTKSDIISQISQISLTDTTEGQENTSAPVHAKVYATNNHKGTALYAIYDTPVTSASQGAVVFCDDGADSTFISREGVKKLKARKLLFMKSHWSLIKGKRSL